MNDYDHSGKDFCFFPLPRAAYGIERPLTVVKYGDNFKSTEPESSDSGAAKASSDEEHRMAVCTDEEENEAVIEFEEDGNDSESADFHQKLRQFNQVWNGRTKPAKVLKNK